MNANTDPAIVEIFAAAVTQAVEAGALTQVCENYFSSPLTMTLAEQDAYERGHVEEMLAVFDANS
jgi:hypothetical protein